MGALTLFFIFIIVQVVFGIIPPISPPSSCDGLIVDKTKWSGHLGGTLKINTPVDISSFIIRFTTDVRLNSITFWQGSVAPTTGLSFTLTNKEWFSGKKAGQFLDLGFQMSFSGDVEPTISGVTLNGVNACEEFHASFAPVGDALTTTTTTTMTTTNTALGHCNTTITNAKDIFEHPECCKDKTILRRWTGCCIDVMDGRDEATCDTPANADADVIDLIYSIVWCPSTIKTFESIADRPICCFLPLIHYIVPGASEECCKRFGFCSEKREKRGLGVYGRVCDLYYCPRKFNQRNWIDNYRECCLHPVRKNKKVRYLYNGKCCKKTGVCL